MPIKQLFVNENGSSLTADLCEASYLAEHGYEPQGWLYLPDAPELCAPPVEEQRNNWRGLVLLLLILIACALLIGSCASAFIHRVFIN